MNRVLMKLRLTDELTDLECKAFISSLGHREAFKKGQRLINEGEESKRCCALLEGFAARERNLASGRKQIVAIILPGDLCDLHSVLVQPMDHTISALTTCKVAYLSHSNASLLIKRYPRLAEAFWRQLAL